MTDVGGVDYQVAYTVRPLPLLNPSGIEPLGHAVLVELFQPEKRSAKIAVPEFIQQREVLIEVRARVIAIGPDAWSDEKGPRCRIGDIVIVSKFAGFVVSPEITADGKPYRCVNGRDIFLRLSHLCPEGE